MAVKKTRQKAQLNYSAEPKSSSLNKREKRKINKSIKSFGAKTICLFLVIFLVSASLGVGVCYLISRKDEFTLLGKDEQVLTVGEKYFEEGFKVVEFGKDKNKKVEIETDMTINDDGSYSPKLDNDGAPIVGTYYIIYKAKTFKYSTLSKIERIRLITFVEASEDSVEV